MLGQYRDGIVIRFCRLLLLLAFVVTILFVMIANHPRSISAQSPTKLWSVDLSKDKDFRARLKFQEVMLYTPSLNFLNNSQIICDFFSTAKDGTGEISTTMGYHVLEIDAHTGTLGRKLEFKALENNYKALPVADGGFIVFADDQLKKYNNHFMLGPSYSTPRVQGGEYFDRWLVDIAPSGQTVLLYSHRPGETQGRWTWLRTTDLTTVTSMQAPTARIIRASDVAGIFDGIDDRELLFGGKTTVLCTRCNVHFLTENLLFLDKQQSYAIQTITGKEQGAGKLDVQALNFSRSAQATRVAYVTGHYVGSGSLIQTNFESITGKIIVLDWNANKSVAAIEMNEPTGNPSAGLTQMALALSPNGEYLAVLLHHTLSLYRLP